MSRITRIALILCSTLAALVACAAAAVAFLGYHAFFPERLSLDDRLGDIPAAAAELGAPVTIRWNEHAVPFIEASSEADAAFALGMVHAHLRGGQLAVLKRVSQGRLSEMAGPFTTDVDHALRILDFGKSAAAMEEALSPESRAWISRFAAGMNHYQSAASRVPAELGLLGVAYEPWTVRDVLVLSRLTGTDVTWLSYFGLLDARRGPNFSVLWGAILRVGEMNHISFEIDERERRGPDAVQLDRILGETARNGSNSVVLGPGRSERGAPLIANDPHLGLRLPNFWIVAGVSCPTLRVVGLMPPGVPLFGLGRNEHLAWGGTNMRAASSDLVDVSALGPGEIESSSVTIRRRLWFDAVRTIRSTRFGPIISDAPMVEPRPGESLALRWMGHRPSDEIGAFLRAAKSSNGAEFRAAFSTFGVSAQNLLYAVDTGEIGHILAARLPRRSGFAREDLVRAPADVDREWHDTLDVSSLPAMRDPKRGYLVSANNRPVKAPPHISFAFSDDDRVRRLESLVESRPKWSARDLVEVQTDVLSPRSRALSGELVRRSPPSAHESTCGVELERWDGRYTEDSVAAVCFELAVTRLEEELLRGSPFEGRWPLAGDAMLERLDSLGASERARLLETIFREVSAEGRGLGAWGAIHRLRAAHLLASLPVIGRLFVIDDFPVGGSRETVMKTSHGSVRGRHSVSYGSQSRHVSDLADPDENYFVLFGGQDGMLGSSTYADQVALWRDGRAMRVPLRPETVRKEFARATRLRP